MENISRCARAIIFKDDSYIFMKREKTINGIKKVYYTTIGGHVENDESYEETCIREVLEETGLNVEIKDLFYEEHNEELNKYEKYYNVNIVSGKLGTGVGPEFSGDYEIYGSYELVNINKEDLDKYNILPVKIKNLLKKNKRK